MRHPRIVIAGAVLAAAAAAGGVTAASAAAGSPARGAPAAHANAAATIRTATVAVAGKTETVLTDARGLPLYIYRPDTATKSLVTGAVARLWPPVVSAAPSAAGVSGKVTVLNDVNGHQVTYNGHPLYTFVSDRPGQVTGQGVQNFFVATPGLAPIAGGSAAATGSAPSVPAGNGYGY